MPKIPPFPRSVNTFVGRQAELRRVLAHLRHEPLVMFYGVSGIGKSELAYRIVDEALAIEQWADAAPILIEVHSHFTIDHLLATLRTRLGVPAAKESETKATLDEHLALIVHALDASASLLFIDDAHHLDAGDVGDVLGYLTRHVRNSRILVASRMEIDFPPSTPAPVVVRLRPFGATTTAEMVGILAHRLGMKAPPAGPIYQRSNGSPFYIQRELARLGRTARATDDELNDSLRALSPAARKMLLLATVLNGRFRIDDLQQLDDSHQQLGNRGEHGATRDYGHAVSDRGIDELQKRFLVEVSDASVSVHNLIRDAFRPLVGEDERRDAHRIAASYLVHRFINDRAHGILDVVEAIRQHSAAHDFRAAWLLIEEHYGAISAAGVDHLLLENLDEIRSQLAADAATVDLLKARIYLRRSMVSEASDVVEKLECEQSQRVPQFRYLLLAGEVAQRCGKLEDAAHLLNQARAAATIASDRFQAGLHLATIASVRGDGNQARLILQETLSVLSQKPTPRQYARWSWVMSLSYAFEERFEKACETASAAAKQIQGLGLDDLIARLAMVECGSRVDCDDITTAQALREGIIAESAMSGALREHPAALRYGIVDFGRGKLSRAREILNQVFHYFLEHDDAIHTCIAGYYLSHTLMGQGNLQSALRIAEQTAANAAQAGLRSHAARAALLQGELLLQIGEPDGAERCARAALASCPQAARGRVHGHTILAHAAALRGEASAAASALAAARRELCDPPQALLRRFQLSAMEVTVLTGDFAQAIALGEEVRSYYKQRGCAFPAAQSALGLATAYIGRGGAADLVVAEEQLTLVDELATSEFASIRLRTMVIEAALRQRRGQREQSQALLRRALRHADRKALVGCTTQLVHASIQGDHSLLPGLGQLLASIGLSPLHSHEVIDRDGRRPATAEEIHRERRQRELVIEPGRGYITGRTGETSVKGRPVTCKLLAALVQAQPTVITAENLYRDVWGASEYHPLRHRNTVYVALNRVRRTLREIYPDRQLVETLPDGWRLAHDVDACAIYDLEGR